MGFRFGRGSILVPTLFAIFVASFAFAQVRSPQDAEKMAVEDEIPAAVLLTERGRQLAEELRQLRRTEAAMGDRHPSRPEVQEKIKEVKEQIEAWSPRVKSFSGNPDQPLPEALPEMNDRDLRQLVLRMAAKISQLERRVESLEKRLDIY